MCNMNGEAEKRVQNLLGNPEWKTQFETPRGWWKDNIKMGLKERGCYIEDWIHLAQYRVQWRAFMNINKHSSFIKGGELFA